jgi:predicted secreted protein
MAWFSVFAVFFVIWWLVLFAVLPFGLKTQDDEGEVTLGTVSSAPRGPHMLRAMLWATLVALVVCGLFYFVTRGLGLTFNDIPRIVPDFD